MCKRVVLGVIYLEVSIALAFSCPYVRTSRPSGHLALSDNDGDVPTIITGHQSFVEGDEFYNRYDEIEAMGGDPWFLGLDDNDSSSSSDSDTGVDGNRNRDNNDKPIDNKKGETTEYKATAGNGPRPIARDEIDLNEWDGREIEDAYFD